MWRTQATPSTSTSLDELADDPPEGVEIHMEDEVEDESSELEKEVDMSVNQNRGSIIKKFFRRDPKDNSLYFCLKCPNSPKVRGKNTSNLWTHFKNHHFPTYLKCHSEQQLKNEGKVKKTTRVETSDDSENSNTPKRLKQSTILETLGKGKKCIEPKVAETALNLVLRCEYASVQIFDSPEFKSLLELACDKFNTFSSSNEVICHVEEMYEVNRNVLSEHLLNTKSKLTVEFKFRNVCELTYFTALVYFFLDERVASAVLAVKKFDLAEDMSNLERDVCKVLLAPDVQDRVGCIIVGPQPGLKEAVLISAPSHIPVMTCLFSSLDNAWKEVNSRIEQLDFFRHRVAPLAKSLFSAKFLGLLREEDRKEVRNARGLNAEVLKLLIKYNLTLVNAYDEDGFDGLSRDERVVAKELFELLNAITKIVDSALLKPDIIHLSMRTTFQTLFAASFHEQTSNFTSPEAKLLAEASKELLQDCFMGGDPETSMLVKLLDYRTKNSRHQNALLHTRCIAKLQDELDKTNNGLGGEEMATNSSECNDGKN